MARKEILLLDTAALDDVFFNKEDHDSEMDYKINTGVPLSVLPIPRSTHLSVLLKYG